MAKVIISYDGTDTDDDALALGRLLADPGELALAYIRHSQELDPQREKVAQHDAERRLAQGAEMLGRPETPQHVVFGGIFHSVGRLELRLIRRRIGRLPAIEEVGEPAEPVPAHDLGRFLMRGDGLEYFRRRSGLDLRHRLFDGRLSLQLNDGRRLFVPDRLAGADCALAMYHDQGLPVLKHASFGRGVNITLGLPIIRTSVDHGTAIDIAGTGRARTDSLIEAVEAAIGMACASARRTP